MSAFRRFCCLMIATALLATACLPDQSPTPTGTPAKSLATPTTVSAPPSTPTLPPAKMAPLFEQGLTTEPLAVLSTSPADRTAEVAVDRATTRLVVQFNHPVVPLTSVARQGALASPITITPALEGQGEWLNTSTYAFTPARDLAVATTYTATVGAATDLLGMTLSGYTWSFRTAAPAIVRVAPADTVQTAATTAAISMTFNTEMDRASTESRFSLTGAGSRVSGSFEWQGPGLRFVPAHPLAYDTLYTARLAAGASSASLGAATPADRTWTFRTVKQPAVLATNPFDGSTDAKPQQYGLQITFASPMDENGLKVALVPTITNQRIAWRYDSGGTIAQVYGGWQPSQRYQVTIGGQSSTRQGERLGGDVVVRFATAPLDPQLYFRSSDYGNFGMIDAGVPAVVYAAATNIDRVDYRLYRVASRDALRLVGRDSYQAWQLYRGSSADLIRQWSQPVRPTLNQSMPLSSTLATNSDDLTAPGAYYLEASAPGLASPARQLLLVTHQNLTLKHTSEEALVWVTSLATGKPVAGQPIRLYGPPAGSSAKAPTAGNEPAEVLLAEGRTDSDGLLRLRLAEPMESWGNLYALSEVEGRVVAAVGSDWQNGISPWEFGLSVDRGGQDYYANLYTDRSIYRPGQSVFFKGIIRADNDANYSLPDLETAGVQLRDSGYRLVYTSTASVGEFGTLDGAIELSEGASTGDYSLSLLVGQRNYAQVSFQVAEYRRPEYQVSVTTDSPEYISGQTIRGEASASYFFGGPVANAAVTWRLMSSGYSFRPATISGWWDFQVWDIDTPSDTGSKVIRDGKGTTDSQGRFRFEVPADVSEYPRSQVFELEAEVTDLSNQSVTGRSSVVVHRGKLYIGLRPQRYVGTVGSSQGIDVITLDTKGISVTSQAVDLQISRREWFSVREKQPDGTFLWRSAYTDTLITDVALKTGADGAAVGRFTPPSGGMYRVLAKAIDSSGNRIQSATFLWVSDVSFVNWRMQDHDRIDLVADKKEYVPGDTAEILIPAPFGQAEALVTLERGAIREVRRLFLEGNSERLRVPITADHAPNIFVSVVLVKGRSVEGAPAQFKVGYINLPVSAAEKELQVSVTADKARYAPGETATFTVQASDVNGRPVRAEFSAALVDKAVQSLVDDRAVPPAKAFWGQRGLGVVTAASLARSVARANQAARDENGKGGGGGLLDKPVREDFRDTAFWNAHLVTDQQGRATFSARLPDNLTTWNMTAKGITASTLVGEARTDILSTKELLIRPVLPRFFVAGDQATIECIVNNSTAAPVSAEVRLQARGITVSGGAQQPLTLPAGGQAKVSWRVSVEQVEEVSVTFSADAGFLRDAAQYTLPVRRAAAFETVATAGQVTTRAAENIQVPASADRSAGGLRISASPSLAAASRESLRHLEAFEYDCSEQTVSRFLPNAATYLALKRLGIEREDLRRDLETNINTAVPILYGLQNRDGGWGWWFGEQSRPALTAYALLGLHTARLAALPIDTETTSRAERFLNNYLNLPVKSGDTPAYNERALVVFVLAEIGRKDMASRAVLLFDQRTSLDVYGKALLLMALQRAGQPQAAAVAAELTSAALSSASGSHWEEKRPDYTGMNTDTRTTAMTLMALGRADPKNPHLANAVRWLMIARRGGHWETTHVTAWSVLALTEYMVNTGELGANYAYEVALNGKPLGSVAVDKSNVDTALEWRVAMTDLLAGSANTLTITRDSSDGRLYYSAYLDYYLPADQTPAINRGIMVGRQYFAVDGQTLQPTNRQIESAQLGDYVQVRLTIVAPTDLHYLVLEDWLPAGLEAVDNTLKTSSSAVASPVLGKGGEASTPATSPLGKYWAPYWQFWAHTDIRDDRVAVFATTLGRGVYEYSYIIRAAVAGQFRALPAQAWEMYFPEVMGRSGAAVFTVR